MLIIKFLDSGKDTLTNVQVRKYATSDYTNSKSSKHGYSSCSLCDQHGVFPYLTQL